MLLARSLEVRHMKQWIKDFYASLRKMHWVTFDHFQFLLLSSFHPHFHSLWSSVHNYFPLFIRFGVAKVEIEENVMVVIAAIQWPESLPSLCHLQEESLHDSFPTPSVALITGAEYWLPFTRGGVTSLVSLKAGIYWFRSWSLFGPFVTRPSSTFPKGKAEDG